jgi:hypothetical protein
MEIKVTLTQKKTQPSKCSSICLFTNSEEMFLAKAILEDFVCNVPPSKSNNELLKGLCKSDLKLYSREKLGEFLRYHLDKNGKPIVEFSEHVRAVRASFDTLVYFFFKIQYLYSNKLIKKNELLYFQYYMKTAFDNKVLWDYVEKYGLNIDHDFVDLVKNLKADPVKVGHRRLHALKTK